MLAYPYLSCTYVIECHAGRNLKEAIANPGERASNPHPHPHPNPRLIPEVTYVVFVTKIKILTKFQYSIFIYLGVFSITLFIYSTNMLTVILPVSTQPLDCGV